MFNLTGRRHMIEAKYHVLVKVIPLTEKPYKLTREVPLITLTYTTFLGKIRVLKGFYYKDAWRAPRDDKENEPSQPLPIRDQQELQKAFEDIRRMEVKANRMMEKLKTDFKPSDEDFSELHAEVNSVWTMLKNALKGRNNGDRS